MTAGVPGRRQTSPVSHKPALSDDMLSEIPPVYEDLSSENLLQWCIGGFIKNKNENLNALIWSFAPKRVFSGAKTVKIGSYLAESICNKGYESILKIMNIILHYEYNIWTKCRCIVRRGE